ncbi:MAG TPA: hypothetical protein VD794_03050 [Flavisolibacter sp.]|nr:hypothetical protein [Flavisolibacter sp.]
MMQVITAKEGQNVLDVVLSACKTIAAAFDLALINGKSITDDLEISEVVQTPVIEYNIQPVVVKPYVPNYKTRYIHNDQTLLDFTCQHAGTMEALFDVALLNNVSITEKVEPQELKAIPIEKAIVSFYLTSKQNIVTDLTENQTQFPGGIGYMQIGNTFKVS